MKKKITILLALVTLAVTSAMANVEIDLNYYLSPVISRTVKNNGIEMKHSYPSYFGLGPSFNFFFGQKASMFDVGLNLDMGLHVISGPMTTKQNEKEYKSKDDFAGVGMFLSAGPVFRITPLDIVSISLIPGLQVGFDVAYRNLDTAQEYGFIDFNAAVSLNAAAKVWLVNKTGFHFGLNVGADVDFPLAGIWGSGLGHNAENWTFTKADSDFNYVGGLNFRAFVGVAFQFGDRAFDRLSN